MTWAFVPEGFVLCSVSAVRRCFAPSKVTIVVIVAVLLLFTSRVPPTSAHAPHPSNFTHSFPLRPPPSPPNPHSPGPHVPPPPQVRKTSTQQVRVTVTAGPLGLGLSLAEEGSRCVVKGFRPMPDGQPNPGQASFRRRSFACSLFRRGSTNSEGPSSFCTDIRGHFFFCGLYVEMCTRN